MPKNEKPIDLEECAREGKEIPDGCELFQIRIDKEKYLVQQAALTGGELLKLAGLDPDCHRVFFRKACGGMAEIGKDEHISLLKAGIERFITSPADGVTIVVNGRKKTVPPPAITFAAVVNLRSGPSSDKTAFTVTYQNGPCDNPRGSMVEGDSVEIVCGMIFNVTATDKS